MISPFTTGTSRTKLNAADLARYQQAGALALDSRRRRPLYFDGRFLAARDLAREQDYFLQRQADLGRAAGFGVVHGLWVEQTARVNNAPVADALVVHAGQGVTPGGELVMLPSDLTLRLSDLAEEERLDVRFGLAGVPSPPRRTRTGIYVLALRPVEFTANPITSYPTSIQGSRTTQDGDIVEATAIALVPYPDPVSSYEPVQRRAALAQQIFLGGSRGRLQDGLLPLALISLQRGSIEWVDPWLVRRETAAEYAGQRYGLTDRATMLAFFMQYDAQLQQIVDLRAHANQKASFSAADYFRVIPPAARFPLNSVSVTDFSQVFFPQQLDVRLSVIPEDELPALLEESMNLPPIDLTQPPESYQQMAVFALVPVPRAGFAELKAKLPEVALRPSVPQIVSFRRPTELLRLYRGILPVAPPAPADNNAWAQAIGTQAFGVYVRRRSAPRFVDFTNA
jgi:hypothetical protein